MKKTILVISMFLVSIAMMAQGTVITKYMNQYAGNEKFSKVSVSQKMFSMFTNLEAGSAAEKEFLQAVSKLKGLKVLMADSIPNSASIYTQAVADVNKAGYEELVSVNDARGNMLCRGERRGARGGRRGKFREEDEEEVALVRRTKRVVAVHTLWFVGAGGAGY